MFLSSRRALPSISTGSPSFCRLRRLIALSAVEGVRDPPLDNRTLPDYFSSVILSQKPERPALICPQERPRAHGGPLTRNMGVEGHLAWDFREFDSHISALARGLVGLGVKKGDRIGVVMGNTSAYAMLQWACASVGAILVTINPSYRIRELVSIETIRLVGVSHLFLVPHIRTSSYLTLLAEALPSLRKSSPGNIQEEALPDLKYVVAIDNTHEPKRFHDVLGDIHCAVDFREVMLWQDWGKEYRLVEQIKKTLDNGDVINLQFTSGTTGMPKAVSLTHHNLLNNGIFIGQAMRLTENDIVCNPPPLFHSRLVLGNLAAWSHGSAIVYPSEIYDPRTIVDAVINERCTALHGVPTHFLGVLAEVERRQKAGEKLDLTRLRTGIAAGSPVPIELMKRLIKKLNLRELTNAYGMTETSPVSFQTTPSDSITQRVETVGRVRPHVNAKIVDPVGNVVPVNTPGELLISGYLVQKGYWRDREQTDLVMRKDDNGVLWMHTGDQATLDGDGYLRIVGRIKDIIIRGGENLFPVHIENALMAHPSILEAAVISVPDKKYGEIVGAWIKPNVGAKLSRESVRKFAWESMNPQNAPAWVWFVGEDGTPGELPKTASGKVQKHILREWSRELAEKQIGLVK
ncbi:acetyl-CoA synthetase-like protein [Multifurca ochricompacta]|uniref:Acetyl-CoA synthetase-like protein n=1 Tax=Multifurca ochricompacta TaxID=376703 RepID=A0AAD4MA58_9AGAM|nr:acetyl-CoA synthetase-like protein [Multifurca ochricompacta]